MPVYVVAAQNVTDPTVFEGYVEPLEASIHAHGGRVLARTGDAGQHAPARGRLEVIEGPGIGGSVVILEFPSWDAVQTWYASPEYTKLKERRWRGAHGSVLLVEGLQD